MTALNPYESPVADVSPRDDAASPTKVRYLVVALCTAMSVLLYLDRFAISTASSVILRDLKLSDEEWGRVQSVFFVYALLQVPAGWLSDRLGAPNDTRGFYVVGWSLATVAMGFANGLLVIVLMRILLGVTQAGIYPAAASLLKRWVPAAARGRGTQQSPPWAAEPGA